MSRALLLVLPIILAVYALIDCAQSEPARVRGPRRALWALLIVLLPVVGPVAWLVGGRPRSGPRRPPRPVAPPLAPDDDPEFLRQMTEIDAEHERLLKQWERDLRRREEELRRGDDTAGGDTPGDGGAPRSDPQEQ
ncbi:MAG TPA: PLD nuclease N-terminal domain-containing protein [Jiangellales bacterium]|nr:PLD nuclease N-terminal domain-containing protein [Jiangellales bacterium]